MGSDHAGFDLKELIAEHLRKEGHELEDLGTYDAYESVDYPLYGAAVGRVVAEGRADLGFCSCGTGMGIALSDAYYPPRSVGGGELESRIITSLSATALGNLLPEFWPDIKQKFSRHKQ